MKTCENCRFFRPKYPSRGFCHLEPPRTAAAFDKEGESHSSPKISLAIEHFVPEVQSDFPACRFFEDVKK